VTLANDPTRMISGNLLHDSSGSMPNHFDVVGVSHVSTIPSPWTPSPASWYDDRYSYVQHHPTIPLVRTAPPNNPPRHHPTISALPGTNGSISTTQPSPSSAANPHRATLNAEKMSSTRRGVLGTTFSLPTAFQRHSARPIHPRLRVRQRVLCDLMLHVSAHSRGTRFDASFFFMFSRLANPRLQAQPRQVYTVVDDGVRGRWHHHALYGRNTGRVDGEASPALEWLPRAHSAMPQPKNELQSTA
jgi:hypothetical protein